MKYFILALRFMALFPEAGLFYELNEQSPCWKKKQHTHCKAVAFLLVKKNLWKGDLKIFYNYM